MASGKNRWKVTFIISAVLYGVLMLAAGFYGYAAFHHIPDAVAQCEHVAVTTTSSANNPSIQQTMVGIGEHATVNGLTMTDNTMSATQIGVDVEACKAALSIKNDALAHDAGWALVLSAIGFVDGILSIVASIYAFKKER